jgi:hypothetical protein
MFGERRKHQRFSYNRIAKYCSDNGTLPKDCMITDFSEQGARIMVPNGAVPDQFQLLISGDQTARETCEVMWRLGDEVGVRFTTNRVKGQRQDLFERLRAEAKQTLRPR